MHPSTRIHLVLACAVYLGALHISYIYLTAPYFGYYGLGYSPTSTAAVVLSMVAALLPVLWLPINTNRPSLVVYYLIYTFVIVPACIVPAYTGALATAELIRLQVWVLLCFGLLSLVYLVPLSQLPRIAIPKTWFFILLFVFSFATYATIVHYLGFSFRFPNPANVYEIRDGFNVQTEQINSTWLAYCMNWQAFVINPFFMAYGLLTKKYHWLVLGLVGELAIYALGGLKQVLFALALVLALYAIEKHKNLGLSILWYMTTFVAMCFISDVFIFHTISGITSMFVRRLIFMPGELTSFYYDFFSNNSFALLGLSILKGFVSYPYSLPPPKLIGAAYFAHDVTDANANYLADGFANFGVAGMLGATVLLAALLWVIDSISTTRSKALVILLLGLPAIEIANSGILTCIANHGVGLAVLLLYLLPREFDRIGQRSARRTTLKLVPEPTY